mmetsp:Transcript_2904/g.8796  ORF Transcript_2904/g.8796 Transcript_2904/m.8796 type:complete len:204 (+) Transcript_2904:166-777(+)
MPDGTGSSAKIAGARTTTARSTSFAFKKWRAVAGPPSTMRRRTPRAARTSTMPATAPAPAPSTRLTVTSPSVASSPPKTSVAWPSRKSADVAGDRRLGSTTTRSGCVFLGARPTRRTVRPGSSRTTVPAPTRTASEYRRSRCTASSDSGDVKRPDRSPRSSTAPLRSTAIFSVTSTPASAAAVLTRARPRSCRRMLSRPRPGQ